jgi:hypothetical protein
MANDLSGIYYLMNDIDASVTTTWNGGAGFIPIGTSGSKFMGKLYGNGYTINNLYINRASSAQSLLGYCRNTIILNVGILNANIIGAGSYGGVLAGAIDGNDVIDSCYSTGVAGGANIGGGFIGSIANYNGNPVVSNCYSTCTITSGLNIGGFIGELTAGTTIYNCYATGDVTTSGSSAGGFIGNATDGNMYYCYSTGTSYVGSGIAGGFCGYTYTTPKISNCWWYNATNTVGSGTGTMLGLMKGTSNSLTTGTFTKSGASLSLMGARVGI